MFELALAPIVYVVCFINIIISTKGMFTTLYFIFKWFYLGPLHLIVILLYDVFNLVNILRKLKGCQNVSEVNEQQKE